MPNYTLQDAALLARTSYTPDGIKKPAVVDRLDKDDVQAVLLENGTLVLPGSNSLADYVQFNLRVFNIGHTQYRFDDDKTEKGASQTLWHQGFLSYARVVYDWVGTRKPTYIIGHSLGSAATQILSKSWNCPAVAFAAPRPKKSANTVVNDGLCLSICREDDPVTFLPLGFNHMGRALRVLPAGGGLFSHAMTHYVDIVKQAGQTKDMPKSWPN
jgi:hypothetical protein